MNMRKIGALAAASMLAIGVVGVASAASVTPTEHSGNITAEGTYKADCPEGFAPLTVDGDKDSATARWGDRPRHLQRRQLARLLGQRRDRLGRVRQGRRRLQRIRLPVSGHVGHEPGLAAQRWQSGPDRQPLGLLRPGRRRKSRLRRPASRRARRPASRRPSLRASRPASPRARRPASPRASRRPRSRASPRSEPSGGVGGETPARSAPPSASPSFDGGVGGETSTPTAPPTDQNGITSSSAPTLPLLLIILGVVGLGAVVLTPRRARR